MGWWPRFLEESLQDRKFFCRLLARDLNLQVTSLHDHVGATRRVLLALWRRSAIPLRWRER
jgi:hypothetical protein